MKVGINGGLTAGNAEYLSRLGVSLYRHGVNWTDLESPTDPAVFNAEGLDELARLISGTSCRWLAVLNGPIFDSCQYASVRGDFSQLNKIPGFLRFLETFAERHDSSVWAYESWNGMDCWEGGPEAYAKFTAGVIQRVRSVRPQAKFIAGSMFNVNVDLYRRMFEAGLLDSGIDYLGVFIYYLNWNIVNPDLAVLDVARELSVLERLKRKYGGGDIPIVVTEVGMPSLHDASNWTSQRFPAWTRDPPVPWARQAELLPAFLSAFETLGVPTSFVHCLSDWPAAFDRPLESDTFWGDWCGLLDKAGTPKPAWHSVQRFCTGSASPSRTKLFIGPDGTCKGIRLSREPGR